MELAGSHIDCDIATTDTKSLAARAYYLADYIILNAYLYAIALIRRNIECHRRAACCLCPSSCPISIFGQYTYPHSSVSKCMPGNVNGQLRALVYYHTKPAHYVEYCKHMIVDIGTVIDAVSVSPTSREWFNDLPKDVLRRYDIDTTVQNVKIER